MADEVSSVLGELRQRIHDIEAGTPKQPASGSARRRAAEEAPKDAEQAFKKIVALMNASDKSQRTVRERLKREGFEEAAREDALERARSYGIVDDARFADVLVRSRLSQGKGRAGIERELDENDIDLSLLPGWPEDYFADEQSELDRALQLLERNPPRSKNQREGAYRKLMQKGFSSSVSSSAARQWSEAAQTR